MKDFQVSSLTLPLCPKGIEIVIGAFGDLYNSVTHKHQRRMALNFLCEQDKTAMVYELGSQYKVENALNIIPVKVEVKNQIPLSSTAIILPTEKRVGRVVREALSKDVPIISFANESVSEYVDHTCGVLIRPGTMWQCVEDFSRTLRMLYFDPEVRKLFHKGAQNRYKEISGVHVRKKSNISYFQSH